MHTAQQSADPPPARQNDVERVSSDREAGQSLRICTARRRRVSRSYRWSVTGGCAQVGR